MNEYEIALRQFLEDEGYTNIEISEGYDENNFEVETDEEDMEFFVGTYNESFEAAKQDVLSLLDEIGIDSLSPDYDWTEFVDDDYFEEAYEEMERSYLEDIRNEDDYKNIYANRLIQELVQDWNILSDDDLVMNEDGLLDLADEDDYDDYIEQGTEALMNNLEDFYETYAEAFVGEFGKSEFKAFVESHGDNVINYEDMAEDIVDTDGMGNSLARYDGVEHEVSVNGTDYYIFRTN